MLLGDQARPRLLGDLVEIIDEHDPRRSDTTLLVAALLTLGIPAAHREFCVPTVELIRGEQKWHTIWLLREESKCGRFKTPAMRRVWSDGAWLLANPQHPLAILRCGLTYAKAMTHTPKFTIEERERIETPDTWLESAMHNLIVILRDLPLVTTASRSIVRFGPRHAALVPRCLNDGRKSRFLKYVEQPRLRSQLSAA
jgi:hypothetical protein